MGDRLREWAGLKRLEPGVSAEMKESNARMGLFTSAIMFLLAAAAIGILVSGVRPAPPAYDPTAWAQGHLLAYVSLLAASANLFACSLLYLRGHVRNSWYQRLSLFAFDVAALGLGIYISSLDYGQGQVLLTFATMVVMCSCLFVVIPVVTFCLDTVAFLSLYLIISSMSRVAPLMEFKLAALWCVVLAVSTVRFNDERTMVTAQLEVTRRSLHDALTDLKNRRSLNEDIERVSDEDLTLAMLDVDDFKFFNDAYGHGVGDSALRQFAKALTSVFPKDSCYRSGGDEFLVLERGTDRNALRQQFERLRAALQDIEFDDESLQVTSSIGAVTGHARDVGDALDMLRLADIAMYDAKRQGKNRIAFRAYDPREAKARSTRTPRALALKVEETDPLTGLLNYTHFRSRAARFLADSRFTRDGLALVYFDIANFRAFNAEYGYESGDAYLQSVADMLRDVFRGQLIARFGEDHFTVLAAREHLAERIMDAHERAHSYQRGVILELKAGVCYPEEGQTDVSALYDRAKLACDSIKTDFDKVYRIYDSELSAQTVRRAHVVNSLDAALERGDVQVYYQPVVRTQTGAVCGVEALTRWIDPTFGSISPAEFVDVLEQYHLVNKLDLHVLETVCRDYRSIVGRRFAPVPISLNLSRLDFELCDIFREVERIVTRYHVPRSMLHLEVTESAFVDNTGIVREQVRRFRDAGYQVWMDDFGSGYSSLNLLQTCEFDLLKIDMLFLRGLDEHRESRIIISSIVDMAKQLGIETLAEGVETPEQLEFLREIGCEKLQGYLFSKPIPLTDLVELVRPGSLRVELVESQPYYTKTGRINLIGRSPSTDDSSWADTAMLPLAVIEIRRGRFRFLSANSSYRALMKKLGIGTLADAERRFGTDSNVQMKTFWDVSHRVKQEGGTRGFDHITNGVHCNTRVSYIATDTDGTDAFLVCTISDADLTQTAEESTLLGTLRFIYSVYTRVDLIAEDNGLMENVYLNSGQYRGEFVRDDARTSLEDFARQNIHPDDRKGFLEYYDLGSIRQRLRGQKLTHLSSFFRTVSPDGGYAWQLYMLIPMERDGRRYWLSCVRDIDPGVMRFIPEVGGINREAQLWRSALSLDDAYIFWKDGDLRFLGANDAFRRFYGFGSADDFVGKTDAEIGWNILEGDIVSAERKVLKTGDPVLGARISCLARGRLRELSVSKVPILDGSRRIGILGVFHPADGTQGGIADTHGFLSAASQYVRAFWSEGRDFRMTCIEIAGPDGSDWDESTPGTDGLMERLADVAGQLAGSRGMVARLGHSRLAIVLQLRDGDATDDGAAGKYLARLSQVRSVDGMPLDFSLRRGSALFSETKGLESLLALVEARLH